MGSTQIGLGIKTTVKTGLSCYGKSTSDSGKSVKTINANKEQSMFWLFGFVLLLIAGALIVVLKSSHRLIFATVVSISFLCLVTLAWVNYKTGIRHVIHLVTQPDDLYSPIVVDSFPFWSAGFSKSYSLTPKYMDVYEIGVQIADGGLLDKKPFNGKVKVEFLSGDSVVAELEATDIQGGVYAGTDMQHYKKMWLSTFEIPISGKYKDDLSVKLTVLEADKDMEKYGDSLQVYIAVSSSP
jgi:hypothetical protein